MGGLPCADEYTGEVFGGDSAILGEEDANWVGIPITSAGAFGEDGTVLDGGGVK